MSACYCTSPCQFCTRITKNKCFFVQVCTESAGLCEDFTGGPAIPVDWFYAPLVGLRSSRHSETQIVFTASNCLRWIALYETYFPQLATLIDVTEKYCRLACVFLGSDSLFLVSEVRTHLERCLLILLKNERNLDFNKEIRGER